MPSRRSYCSIAIVLSCWLIAGCGHDPERTKPERNEPPRPAAAAPGRTPGVPPAPPSATHARHEPAADRASETATAAASGAPSSVRIPVRQGLTIVTAVSETAGDYESIKTIVAADASTLTLAYTADHPVSVKSVRPVRLVDLTTGREYARWFSDGVEPIDEGATAFGTSTAVLADLAAGRDAEMSVAPSGSYHAIHSVLHRVEPADVGVPVIVNDRPAVLPAIHAHGNYDGDEADFYFLDDPLNPVCLRFTIGRDRLTVIKIAYPPGPDASAADDADSGTPGQTRDAGSGADASPAPRIERALERTGRAEIYGIYFDFASARIKDESEPVLRAIADVLAKNPSWTLSVEGHTDNIGGDRYNLALSEKRAAAVKDALVTRYHVHPDRLAPAGFGARRPKDTNDTIEGRARNRRVELVRQ